MEKLNRTASLTLRYGLSLRSFENKASSSTKDQLVRNSDDDIDFEDVFGGPPVWTRYSYSGSRIKPWEESTISPTGSVEMPVFGEPYSRRTSDDFFCDNFRRSSEFVRSGSSMLNPAKFEPLATSIPAEFRSSSPATQVLRNSSGQSTGQALLYRKSSSVKEPLCSTRSAKNEIDHKSKARTGSPSTEFHFSIYKWANLGVPLLMSACGNDDRYFKNNQSSL